MIFNAEQLSRLSIACIPPVLKQGTLKESQAGIFDACQKLKNKGI
jgi:hypothetical protein